MSLKKELTILGINSGTSADGIDLAVIKFICGSKLLRISFIEGTTIPYPERIKAAIEKIIGDNKKNVEELARFDLAYGRYLGDVVSSFICRKKLKVDLIASHGQTVGHYPLREKTIGIRTGSTIQLGDGNAIATRAGLPTISDFRKTDIAFGGEGAPLTPFVNHMLFADKKHSRLIINIGGISNYSYHPAGGSLESVEARDCGPGNILSDLACRFLFDKKYDRDGVIARTGGANIDIIKLVKRANSWRRVSAGREQFDVELLARIIHTARKNRLDNADTVTSVAEATIRLIHESVRKYLSDKRMEGVYLTGGGRRNLYMVDRLRNCVDPIPVWPVEALGYDGDLLEAVSFAVLGGCFVHGVATTLPKVTGASPGGVAGKLSLPPGKT
jgi:anhydro-N-acetylmuramic acid kinase